MRKIILGILGLFFALGIYYFTSGKEHIAAEIKVQLHKELTALKTQGFTIQEKDSKKKEEHFTLTFDDPKKISLFFTSQGVKITVSDAQMLKGLKLGVDVAYLSDAYSAVSFDIYPVTLPTVFTSKNTKDKKVLDQVQKMLDKKTFLMHLALNKLGTGFKGYMKDINEVLRGEKDVTLGISGLTFSGDLKENKMQSVTQNLKQLSLSVPDEVDMTLINLIAQYNVTGSTPYDYSTDYSIGHIRFDAGSKFTFHTEDTSIQSVSTVKNGLASGTMSTKIKLIYLKSKDKTSALKELTLDISAKNLDIKAFEKLQQINVNNRIELNTALQELISKGVKLSIPTFSVPYIEVEGKKMQGFDMNAKIDIVKSLNISALQRNPMAAVSAIDAHIALNLSAELFNIISQQPKAMMALMLFQPKDKNGQKSYEVDLKAGKLLVNSMPVF
jgi:hypothetical protein